MKLSMKEKKVLYVFACPNHHNTVTRLKWLTALTVDPQAKHRMLELARKMETEMEESWYTGFYHQLRAEMDEYYRYQQYGEPPEQSSVMQRAPWHPGQMPWAERERHLHGGAMARAFAMTLFGYTMRHLAWPAHKTGGAALELKAVETPGKSPCGFLPEAGPYCSPSSGGELQIRRYRT